MLIIKKTAKKRKILKKIYSLEIKGANSPYLKNFFYFLVLTNNINGINSLKNIFIA